MDLSHELRLQAPHILSHDYVLKDYFVAFLLDFADAFLLFK